MLQINGVEQLTSTTGVVRGEQNVIDFIDYCNNRYTKVFVEKSALPGNGYLQYTLLTDNRIRLYL